MRRGFTVSERRLLAKKQPAPKSELWAVCFNNEPIYTFPTFGEAVARFNMVEHVAGTRTTVKRIN